MRGFRSLAALILIIILGVMCSCQGSQNNFRSELDLSGDWQFQLDGDDEGIDQQWYSRDLGDNIQLPGTTDLAKKGNKNRDTTTLHLSRLYTWAGPAWYRKKISIPEEWDKHLVRLTLERTKPSKIWIDDHFVGESYLLESPQVYDLSSFLSPGEHTLTIRVNNNLELTPYGNVHIYSDDTQTNWNGIIGDIFLQASEKTYISDLQVYPDIDSKKINISVAIDNQLALDEVDVELQVTKKSGDQIHRLKSLHYTVSCDTLIKLEYLLNDEMDLWDEYSQPLYTLNVLISHDAVQDNLEVPFGMRKFAPEGRQFAINHRITFLRGKHDACVFPLSGHPPMDMEGWVKVFEIAKSYGINHYRFHTWCPPEAAFEAADRTGIYLQPELPFWGGLESDTTADRLKAEGIALLKSYANHPSFVMFSPGNEIWSGHERVEKIITELKELDGRPLYTQGSNNNIGYMAPRPYSDFHIAARTPYSHDTTLTHIRLTHGFVDARDGGILNTQLPSTKVNFDYSVSHIDVPLLSHEIGQYQIYPDFKEIEKYTGVLKAWNLEEFRHRLENAGMLDQNADFNKASGALSAISYRAEIEAALRTEHFGGFKLLDLQDFPGQGTALVGILDAFMDSKNVISRDKWIQFCNDVVPLLLFDKYCWTTEDDFSATVQVANYSNRDISKELHWVLRSKDGRILKEGLLEKRQIAQGGLRELGEIEFALASVDAPEKLNIELIIGDSGYKNSYPIWVYPVPQRVDPASDISVITLLDEQVIAELKEGKKVLYIPKESTVENNSLPGLFPPDFWNYGMFKGISEGLNKPVSPGTLGILCDPDHPVFNSFPTEFHTNWQWWSIIKNSRPLVLNSTSPDYRPLVQVIDNVERNDKLGLIFEFKVGRGKLLVCMSDLNWIRDRPEGSQLYNSLISYMNSDQFNPEHPADDALLLELFP